MKISKYTIKELDKIDREIIKDITSSSKEATVFHTIEWNETLSMAFGISCKVHIARENNIPKGFVFIHPERVLRHININWSPNPRYDAVYGGPIAENSNKEVIRTLIGSIGKIAHVTLPPSNKYEPFLKAGYTCSERKTAIIDFHQSQKQLWSSMKKRGRYEVKRIEKNDGVSVQSQEIITDEMLNLLNITYEKFGGVHQNLTSYKNLFRKLLELNMLKIFTLKHNGNLLNSSFFLLYNDRAYFWLSASNLESLKRSSLSTNIVQWEFMKWAKQNGYKFYDMLGLDVPSIAKFKESFGGKKIEFYTCMSKEAKILSKLKRFLNI